MALLPVVLFRLGNGDFLATGDNYLDLHGAAIFFFENLKNGSISLWSPHLCGGMPINYGNFSVFYPIYYLYLVLPPASAFNAIIYLTYFIACAGVFFFMREWKTSRPAAFFAAIAFGYGAFNLSWFHALMAVQPAIWTGWFFLFLEKSRKSDKLRGAVFHSAIAALVFALMTVAGHPQITLYVSLAAAAYVLYFSLREKTFRFPILAALSVAFGTMMAAPHLMMSWSLGHESFRSALDFEHFNRPEMPIAQFIGGLFDYNAMPNANFAMYIGFLPILFALVELTSKNRHKLTPLAIGIIAVAVPLALGQSTGLNKLMFHVPIYNLFSFHSRHMVEIGFFSAILGGLGLDRILKGEAPLFAKRPLAITAALFVASTILLAFTPFKPDSRLLVAPILAMVSLAMIYMAGSRTNLAKYRGAIICLASMLFLFEPWKYYFAPMFPFNRAEAATGVGAVAEYIAKHDASDGPRGRVYTLINPLFTDSNQLIQGAYGNTAAAQGMYSSNGYHPAMSRRYKETMKVDIHGWPDMLPKFFAPGNRALDLLATRYIAYDPAFYLKRYDEAGNPLPNVVSDGIEFGDYLEITLKPGEKRIIVPAQREADRLAVVTTLSGNVRFDQGAVVAKATVRFDDGSSAEFAFKAGENTAVYNHASLSSSPEAQTTIEGVPYFGLTSWYLRQGEQAEFVSSGADTRSLGLLSYLIQSDNVKDGEVVAIITISSNSGEQAVAELKAGSQTADWAIEDSSRRFAHTSPKLYRRVEKKGEKFAGRDFPSTVALPRSIAADKISIRNPRPDAVVVIEDMTLIGDGVFAPAYHPGVPQHSAPPAFPKRWNAPPGYTEYLATFEFGRRAKIAAIELASTTDAGSIDVSYLSLYDSTTKTSSPATLLNSLLSDANRFAPLFVKDDVALLENKSAMPRAWLAKQAVVMPFESQVAVINSGSFPDGEPFDPASIVLIETPPSFDATGAGAAAQDSVRFVGYSPDDITLDVSCAGPRFLVLSESYYPGWSALVDGKPAQLVPADGMLRALPMTGGSHRVRLHYSPPGLMSSVVPAALALLVSLGIVAVGLAFSFGSKDKAS